METKTLRTLEEHLERFPKCFQLLIKERIEQLHKDVKTQIFSQKLSLNNLLFKLAYERRCPFIENDRYWWSGYEKELKSKKIIIKHDLCDEFQFNTNLRNYYCKEFRHFELAKNKYPELKGFTIKDFNITMT